VTKRVPGRVSVPGPLPRGRPLGLSSAEAGGAPGRDGGAWKGENMSSSKGCEKKGEWEKGKREWPKKGV